MVQYSIDWLSDHRMESRSMHKSPVTVSTNRSGFFCRGRMMNFCGRGLYFETNAELKKETFISICIKNSPYASDPDVRERYSAVIKWRKQLKNDFFDFGYGAHIIPMSQHGPNKRQPDRLKANKKSRRYPRKRFSKPTIFSSNNQYHSGLIKNICKGGMFIETKEHFIIGQTVKLIVPGTQLSKGVMIEGQVVYVSPSGFGLKIKGIRTKGSFSRQTGKRSHHE